MAQTLLFKVTVKDTKYDDVLQALLRKYNYPTTIPDGFGGFITNPEAPLEWLKRTRKEAVLEDYMEQKKKDAKDGYDPGDPGLGD